MHLLIRSFAARVVGALLLMTAIPGLGWTTGAVEDGPVVSVYSHRHYEVDQQLYDRFYRETGIRVQFVNAGADELIERLKAEGTRSPADLLITVDAGRLNRAQSEGLLQPVSSLTLETRIPEPLREPDGYWFGLTKRARVIVRAVDRVAEGEISTYESLADLQWKGRIAVRSSSNVYNQSLMASIIAAAGTAQASAWARGVVDNLARDPIGNDRDQMKAVAAGIADLALVNTYYVGLMAVSENPEERRVVDRLAIVFPNQDGRGTHVNVSGAGVTAHAPNRENAIRLLEFLVSDEAQAAYAAANFEYPVVESVLPSALVASWGSFHEDTLSLATLGAFNTEAVRVMDLAGWR